MPPPSRQGADYMRYRPQCPLRRRFSKAKKSPASKPKNLTYNKKILYSHYQTYANRSRFAGYMVIYQHNNFVQYAWEKELVTFCNLTYNNLFNLIY